MEQFKTVKELRAYIEAHCGGGVDCDRYGCIGRSTRELREEYAAKYGCICIIDCRKCLEYNNCYPTKEKKEEYEKSDGLRNALRNN